MTFDNVSQAPAAPHAPTAPSGLGHGPAADPPDLRRPAHRVSPRARTAWRIGSLVGWLMLLTPAAVAVWRWEESRSWSLWTVAALAAVALVHAAIMPEWRFRVHRWEVDDLAVHTLTGWISQTSRVAPVSRIQTVDSSFGPVQRLFGLGTLTVTTASAAGPVQIDGLERALVEELVARLTAVTAADEGDAT